MNEDWKTKQIVKDRWEGYKGKIMGRKGRRLQEMKTMSEVMDTHTQCLKRHKETGK